jgi:hypothetical protein
VAAAELHGLCSSKLSCAREVGVKAATKNTQGLLGASCDHCVPLEGSAVNLPTNEMFVYYLVTMVVLAAVTRMSFFMIDFAYAAEGSRAAAHDIFAKAAGIVIRRPAAASDGTTAAAPAASGSLAGTALLTGKGTTAAAPLDGDIARQPVGSSATSTARLTGSSAMEVNPSGTSGVGQPASSSLAGTAPLAGSVITAAAPLDGSGGRQPAGGSQRPGTTCLGGSSAASAARLGSSNADVVPLRPAGSARTVAVPPRSSDIALTIRTRSSGRRTHTVANRGGGSTAPFGSFAAKFAPFVQHISDEEALAAAAEATLAGASTH